jgi:hypothetical protein
VRRCGGERIEGSIDKRFPTDLISWNRLAARANASSVSACKLLAAVLDRGREAGGAAPPPPPPRRASAKITDREIERERCPSGAAVSGVADKSILESAESALGNRPIGEGGEGRAESPAEPGAQEEKKRKKERKKERKKKRIEAARERVA